MKSLYKILLFAISIHLMSNNTFTKSNQEKEKLRNKLQDIISQYKANVGLSAIEIETGDTITINNKTQFAMQSVYKFPLALAVLNQVEKGEINLQQKIHIDKQMLDKFKWSPLKRKNPSTPLIMSVDSLIMYMIGYSDNLACDVLFDLVGGTKNVNKFIRSKGFSKINIKNTEIEIGQKPDRMYQNSSTPNEMSALLKSFYELKIINKPNTDYLLNYMINDSSSHNRIIGKLPAGTIVAHKTGTGLNNNNLIAACNDVGIIYLPNGKHLALSVFVMDTKEKHEDIENLISLLSKEVYEYYEKRK